ncbi:MAG TPA: YXWGXW repeat-containing protein [Bradyrhizobium sp.]|uniref:YXWGXW repeat-containing protein n=1 Tax=Bradyrhizobium sp. TaxID=376 RepID=UPI002D7F6A9E|nr:YXWGXW repeat-containing protein [Bradyrhizobium sp.]HET7887049.1 YXWGXW repeat-containing protein [Bradyrhizobium sp.]
MRKLAVGLISLSITCGSCAFAQSTSQTSNFPSARFLQFPPHFQPRLGMTADKISTAPPALPSYAQPPIPEDGYLWMPGFWAWRKDVPDYYWVPGTWVRPPRAGLLWTPPYWSRVEGGYAFHDGYWAADVGFYGGIDYGFGYSGNGFQGGYWQNATFVYNQAANNLGAAKVEHSYDQAILVDNNQPQASFNGGSRGTKAKPTSRQEELAGDEHVAPTAEQQAHFELAAKDRSLYSRLNGGKPGVAATVHAGVFSGAGVIRSTALLEGAAQANDAATTGENR